MSDKNNGKDIDTIVVIGLVFVFGLPVTLLIPNFSVWDVIPKLRVSRCHIITQELTWPQINAAIVMLLSLFFCLYLEIQKRKLDDMVEKVLTVSQATDTTLEVERERQTGAMRACLDLLDASTEHYEHLVLLRDELRKRDTVKHQQPPAIEPSASSF
ncbi:hypothetical protein K1T71_002683 [Dendrolimus kikuchii]|uniref:Uncharacterized protein n=1 Tax=Dendrolimus kikuchii TaxID=765133 RepID=A0ACC1DDN3_9NEOP|nr:hypothetical protein K1T71_002683 [Dendrolimus kikuchii]